MAAVIMTATRHRALSSALSSSSLFMSGQTDSTLACHERGIQTVLEVGQFGREDRQTFGADHDAATAGEGWDEVDLRPQQPDRLERGDRLSPLRGLCPAFKTLDSFWA